MSPWSGKTLGKVKIGDLIARGGMAEVYQGEHILLNRKVAVKIMHDHVDEDPETRQRFEREARVVAGLHHPNIIQIFDYDLADGRPSIVMELVPGISLAVYLKALQKRGERLSFEEIVQVLRPIASAVDYAHKNNIVHRDIKPANILLRSVSRSINIEDSLPNDVEPVLTDFGLVRLLDSSIQTSTGTVSGTPAYMSPEQARGDKVTEMTDIYSLGVVLYELMAGSVPFDSESSFGVLMKHLNDPPPPISEIAPDLQAVIDRALAKDPTLRYQSVTELVEEFVSVFNGRTLSLDTREVQEKIKSDEEESAAGAKRIPKGILYAAGAVILAIVGALVFMLFRPTPVDPNKPVGMAAFTDFNYAMDKFTVSINGLPAPQKGTHYEAWQIGQGGEFRSNMGTITMDGKSGQISYLDPKAGNIFERVDQVKVTLEADDDPQPDQPSGNVVASFIFPPLSLIHVRHLLAAFPEAPENAALIQGLWVTTDAIDTSAYELGQAFDKEDEEVFRTKAEEIINQISGSENSDLYKDWSADGRIDNPSDGYGLLENGEQGYVPQTVSHAQFAMDASDATENIKMYGAQVITCSGNIESWAKEMLGLALQLQNMSWGPEMKPIVDGILELSSKMLYGLDADNSGQVESIPGECGADQAYIQSYFLADMPLFPGPDRIPPPANP
ncbi:MAG TPA: protein kinase [Anaerolineales bacterium]|nr:protein kinase [Anaerolineales bacterium]